MVTVAPTQRTDAEARGLGKPISGSPEEIAAIFQDYAHNGFSEIQAVIYPYAAASIEAMAPVLEMLDRAGT